MASNQPHTKRDVGGQSAKSKDNKDSKAKTPPPAPKGPQRKS